MIVLVPDLCSLSYFHIRMSIRRMEPHTTQYGKPRKGTNNNEPIVITYHFQCPHANFGCLNML